MNRRFFLRSILLAGLAPSILTRSGLQVQEEEISTDMLFAPLQQYCWVREWYRMENGVRVALRVEEIDFSHRPPVLRGQPGVPVFSWAKPLGPKMDVDRSYFFD